MIKQWAIGLFLCCVLGIATADEKTAEAVVVAEAWLEGVDAGEYSNSWQEAAEYFKAAVTQEDWERSLSAVRAPLGKTVSRTMKTQQYMTSLPGSPDGEYVVVQFQTVSKQTISARNSHADEGYRRSVADIRLLHQINVKLVLGDDMIRFVGFTTLSCCRCHIT